MDFRVLNTLLLFGPGERIYLVTGVERGGGKARGFEERPDSSLHHSTPWCTFPDDQAGLEPGNRGNPIPCLPAGKRRKNCLASTGIVQTILSQPWPRRTRERNPEPVISGDRERSSSVLDPEPGYVAETIVRVRRDFTSLNQLAYEKTVRHGFY